MFPKSNEWWRKQHTISYIWSALTQSKHCRIYYLWCVIQVFFTSQVNPNLCENHYHSKESLVTFLQDVSGCQAVVAVFIRCFLRRKTGPKNCKITDCTNWHDTVHYCWTPQTNRTHVCSEYLLLFKCTTDWLWSPKQLQDQLNMLSIAGLGRWVEMQVMQLHLNVWRWRKAQRRSYRTAANKQPQVGANTHTL